MPGKKLSVYYPYSGRGNAHSPPVTSTGRPNTGVNLSRRQRGVNMNVLRVASVFDAVVIGKEPLQMIRRTSYVGFLGLNAGDDVIQPVQRAPHHEEARATATSRVSPTRSRS